MTRPAFGLYGIFGFPLGYTLSPVMQEAAFRALGLKAFYLPFEVRWEEFRRLMRERSRLLLDGFNVTVPYKEEVLRYLDGLSPSARAIGAVNTVVRKGRRWIGFNTDEIGFGTSLQKEGKFEPRAKQVLILGAGGSARAVAYALARRGARRIVIENRTPSRAKKIVLRYRKLFPKVEWEIAKIGKGAVPESTDLVVNVTSVGLRPRDPSLASPAGFPEKTLFVDLIYNPRETRFLRLARESGHRTLNGLGMLVYQGAEAFRLWTGRKAPVKMMLQVMRQASSSVIGRRPPISTGGRLPV